VDAGTEDTLSSEHALATDKVSVLVAQHARFLAFLKPRVGSTDAAEEILQAAFVKGLEKQATIREGESAVGWFFRLLRNAVVDHYRRNGAARRGQQRFVAENPEPTTELDTALTAEVCACVDGLIPTLKPEYADLLRRVELGGASVVEAAAELGVTPNNAAVRLHRARAALKKRLEQTCGTCTEHGCLECTCEASHC